MQKKSLTHAKQNKKEKVFLGNRNISLSLFEKNHIIPIARLQMVAEDSCGQKSESKRKTSPRHESALPIFFALGTLVLASCVHFPCLVPFSVLMYVFPLYQQPCSFKFIKKKRSCEVVLCVSYSASATKLASTKKKCGEGNQGASLGALQSHGCSM